MARNGFWQKTKFLPFLTIFDHFGLGIDACSTITRCLSLPKRDDKKLLKRAFFSPSQCHKISSQYHGIIFNDKKAPPGDTSRLCHWQTPSCTGTCAMLPTHSIPHGLEVNTSATLTDVATSTRPQYHSSQYHSTISQFPSSKCAANHLQSLK